eukprot:CAMPEP_0117504104 /NCGR_PEP_ID=MMETSP0784-20121206/24676_1 /TAXON_ID=39447 /ORGANISM="" /LENGTH=631 /DNA_ID=CAMNT_0005299447 /DNA_START=86 /DNA_END=1981 /DNA_ORIENTATION=+
MKRAIVVNNVETEYTPMDTEDMSARIKRLQEDIERYRETVDLNNKKLTDLKEYWATKALAIESIILDAQKKIDECEETIDGIEQERQNITNPTVPFPGPSCLKFVDGDQFSTVATTVIAVNIVTILIVFLHPHLAGDFFWLDQFCMVFYVAELSLKAAYKHGRLLFGECSTVIWNWIDLLIVVTGVVDMWLMPVLLSGSTHGSGGPSVLSYLRLLRLARLARVLKILRVIIMSDMSWTEGNAFQSFIMGVIALNAILIGLEADHPGVSLWFYLEQLLLFIFTFELFTRMKRYGLRFFFEDWVWNWLDGFIVLGGILDQWVMPTITLVQSRMGIEAGHSNKMGQVMMVLRMARLLRILRLVRLVKSIPPLYTLIIGIVKAMAGMGWVIVLTIVVLYVFALLGVKLVGHGLLFSENVPVQVAETFPRVFDSMFNLFMVMNADLSSMEHLFAYAPIFKYIMMLYVVVMNWAIFSILTAVVSDNMAAASQEHDKEVEEQHEQEKNEYRMASLQQLFDEMDEDRDGTITKSEFDELLADSLKSQELCDAASLKPRDLEDMFELTSFQGKDDTEPVINRERFLKSLQQEGVLVRERSVMRLEKRVSELAEIVKKRFDGIDDVVNMNSPATAPAQAKM